MENSFKVTYIVTICYENLELKMGNRHRSDEKVEFSRHTASLILPVNNDSDKKVLIRILLTWRLACGRGPWRRRFCQPIQDIELFIPADMSSYFFLPCLLQTWDGSLDLILISGFSADVLVALCSVVHYIYSEALICFASTMLEHFHVWFCYYQFHFVFQI